jgi:hypothetical protein
VDLARTVLTELGPGGHDRDSVAQALGYSKGEGLTARKIAALAQYGLFDRDGNSYSPTKLLSQIVHPISEPERDAALKTAFESPTLFAEVLAKYREHRRIPGALPNILLRDHGITQQAAGDAAEVFLSSGRFAGVLDESGAIASGEAPPRKPDAAASASSSQSQETSPEEGAPRRAPLAHDIGDSTGRQTFSLQLASGVARLELPAVLQKNDLLKLSKLLELLALGVGDEN